MRIKKYRDWFKQLISLFHLNTIRVWLPLTLVLIVILVTVAITTGNVVNGFRREQQQAVNQLEVIAQLKEAEMEVWIQQLQRDLSTFLSQEPYAGGVRTLLQNERGTPVADPNMFTSLLQPGNFDEITLVDADGTATFPSNPMAQGTQFPAEIYADGNTHTTLVASPYYSPQLNKVIFVQPVFNPDGQLLGALVGQASLRRLNDIMRSPVTANDGGQAYLVDSNQNLLTQAAGLPPSKLGNVRVDSIGIGSILAVAGNSGSNAPARYEDYRGVQVIGIAHWLPDLQVALLAERSQRQVFASLFATIVANSSLALSATVLAIIIGLSITQSITNPLSYLANQAKLIADGKLDRRIKLERDDEIGDLARAFDGMTLRLRELIGSLEQRVADRTQRLEVVASIGEHLNGILAYDALLAETVEQVKENFDYPLAQIYLANARCQDLVLVAECADPGATDSVTGTGSPLPGTKSIISRAARQSETLFYLREQAPSEEPDALTGPANLLGMAVPITVEGNVIGVLYVQDRTSQNLHTEDASVLRSLTNHLGIALNNARLFEETQQRASELAGARDAAEAANRAKSTFLANMSHELRTPLNAILGFTQIMERDARFPKKHKENLQIISRSGAHLLDLINDVLEISKIEAGQNTLEKSGFDLGRTLNNLEKMFRIRAEKKDLRMTFELAEDLPKYIETDERKLRQVLINLLGNAVKFTEQGSVTLRVWTAVEASSNGDGMDSARFIRLYFEVEDTGPGIEADEIDRLFNAFTQTRTGQKLQEGTGLGLAISYQFVQLMEGNIDVTSEVGRGATFSFHIRVRLASGCDRALARRVLRLEPGQAEHRILVADDNFENRTLLRKMLQSVGFAVMEASNGQEAVEIFSEWQPHLIWMDMRMPVLDGREATQQIKSTAQGKRTPIIAVTASAFKEERAAVLALGCNDFVGKPFQEAEIFDIMARHLNLRYVYENQASTRLSSIPESNEQPLEVSDLMYLPTEWREALHNVAMRGHARQALELIEQIAPEYPQIAERLSALVKEFRYDQLVAVTKRKEE